MLTCVCFQVAYKSFCSQQRLSHAYMYFVGKPAQASLFTTMEAISLQLQFLDQCPGTMSWTAASLKSEIEAMANLLKARPGIFDLEDKPLYSVKQKLSMMSPIANSDLVQLYDAVTTTNLTERIRNDFLGQLDQMAVTAVEPHGAVKLVNGAQECKTYHKYLTAKDLAALQVASMWEGCSTLASRMKLLGIKGMKESLKKLCCGILVWHERQRTQRLPHPDLVYNLSQHLMHALQTEKALALSRYLMTLQGWILSILLLPTRKRSQREWNCLA